MQNTSRVIIQEGAVVAVFYSMYLGQNGSMWSTHVLEALVHHLYPAFELGYLHGGSVGVIHQIDDLSLGVEPLPIEVDDTLLLDVFGMHNWGETWLVHLRVLGAEEFIAMGTTKQVGARLIASGTGVQWAVHSAACNPLAHE